MGVVALLAVSVALWIFSWRNCVNAERNFLEAQKLIEDFKTLRGFE